MDAASDTSGEIVALRDGARVRIRPVRARDRELFVAGFARLSDESRYKRFLAAKSRLTEKELDFFTLLDHDDHEALGAQDLATGDGLGVARYIRLAESPDTAEAAVVVIDSWQGRGLGTALLERLAATAAARGIEHFVATLLARNHTMLHLFDALGDLDVRRDGTTVEIDVRLAVHGSALGEVLRAAATGAVEAVPGARALGAPRSSG